MNRSSMIFCAGSVLSLLAAANTATAATQVYGFNSPTIDGFSIAYDGSDSGTATATQSTTTGVAEGTGALHIHGGASSGFTQTDAFTGTVPAALLAPSATSDSMAVTTNYNDAQYMYITQVFFLEGTRPNGSGGTIAVDKKLIPFNTSENNPLSPADTATPKTLNYNLKNYKDPFGSTNGQGTTALFTPGEILANNQAFFAGSDLSIPTFGFEVFHGGSAGVDFYIDNLSVAGVPEPTSMGLLAATGVLIGRRRARRLLSAV